MMRLFAVLALLLAFPLTAASADWGGIKGRVVFAGPTLPASKPLDVNKDQGHCLSKGPLLSEDMVVNKDNKGVRWVFVWLAPVDANGKLEIHPDLKDIKIKEVEIDQPCCQFVPHALAIREGQVVVAKNPAPVAHNFHWQGHPLKNPGGNVIVPSGQSLKVDALKADHRTAVKLSCDIHPWMSGYMRVFDHPYFAVTDADGNFEIKNAPTGKLMMWVWQESTGWLPPAQSGQRYAGVPVEIEAGKITSVGEIKIQ